MWTIGGTEKLKNTALLHHQAADTFCRQRAAGCTWAEHHALVDHSRAPYAHVYDSMSIAVTEDQLPARPTRCERLHKPSADELRDLVHRSQPAVLTGLLDGWPALERWSDAYLARELGAADVAISVSEGWFDHPEPPERWGLARNESLTGVVARPAHVPMKLGRALDAMLAERTAASGTPPLTGYLEYLPMDFLTPQVEASGAHRAHVLHRDLRPAGAGSASSGSIDASETGGGGDTSTSPASRIRNDELPRMAAAALSISHPPVLRARGTSEPGRLLPAAWLIPRKHLLWLGGGGTVGSTHFDPYENLMAVIGGQKTFHLARPEDGSKLGAHQMMAEGGLKLERRVADDAGAANAGADFLSRHRLVRSPSAVDDALDLHHYATASLSAPDGEPQLGLPLLAEVNRVRCSAKAGEVVYTPSYWWHEVTSHASDDGRLDGDAKSRRAVIALNWFFEPYYTRVFPNRSFERSPHYVLLDQQRPLDDPYPARIPSTAATARTPMDDALSASAGTAERSAGRGGTSRFNVRLRESKRERATGRQPTRRSHDSSTSSSGGAKTEL